MEKIVEVEKVVEKEVPVEKIVEVAKVVEKEIIVVATHVCEAQEAGFELRPPEQNVKRGCTLRAAFGVTMTNFDVQQGAGSDVLGHLYNKLVTKNLAGGPRTTLPDLAVSWDLSSDAILR